MKVLIISLQGMFHLTQNRYSKSEVVLRLHDNQHKAQYSITTLSRIINNVTIKYFTFNSAKGRLTECLGA
jgi:hypothetical protein